MVSTKNLISSNITSQVPSFIADEYPLFVDFIQTYYQGQETSGQPLDLVNNLLEHLDVDVLQTPVKEYCTTSASISISDTEIQVNSTEGFPEKDGLIQIGSEIILYKTKTNTSFANCSRGVSGVTKIGLNFEYSYSTPSTHTNNSKVINLSYLFLLYYFSKIKSNYLPFFNQSLATGINVSNFIKNIKQFYNSKGTSKSFDFLIRALFNVKNETLYPRERLLKSSDAVFSSPTVVRCTSTSTDPKDSPKYLSGQQLYQTTLDRDPAQDLNGQLVSYAVTSVEETFDYNTQIYQLSVDKTNSTLDINLSPKTKLLTNIGTGTTIITVDSTIGFPGNDGYLKLYKKENGVETIEYIKYSEKTLNQFLYCQRGYAGTGATSWNKNNKVESTQLLYGYSNLGSGHTIFINVLGIASEYNLINSGKNYNIGDKVATEKLGYSDEDPKSKFWIINYPTISNENTVNFLQSHFSDVISIYKNSEGYYVASSGVPSHPIGSGFTEIGNQRHLKKIPSQITTTISEKVSQRTKDSAIFLNGVTLQSPISDDIVYWGNIESFNILNNGENYGVGYSGGPTVIITPGQIGYTSIGTTTGTGVTTTAKALIDGRVVSAKVLNGGSGYTEDAIAQVVGSNGDGATLDLVISNGVIVDVLVTNSGSGYNFLPEVEIINSSGSGAVIALEVSGPITEVYNLDDGLTYTTEIDTRNDNYDLNVGRDKLEIYTRNYTDLIDVEYDEDINSRYVRIYTRGSNLNTAPRVNLISTGTTNIYNGIPSATVFSGDGATGYPVIENGKIVSVAVSSSGYGYNSSPKVYVNDSTGVGFGAEIYANIENGRVVSFTVLRSGANYTADKTTISVVPSGNDAVIVPVIKGWIKDNYKKYENLLDDSNGYLYISSNSSYGKRYSYIANPRRLRRQLGDNITDNLTEQTTGLTHSKIIGWSYDGHPIYGPYGYGVANNNNSPIQRMVSKYSLKSYRVNGPDISSFPLGTFIDDYELNSNGTLDEYNGRYCVTPDSNGEIIYAYFMTINSGSAGVPAFPYVIGPKYNSIPDQWNYGKSNQNNLPLDVLRYRTPFENTETFPEIGKVSNIRVSSINSNFSSKINGFNILYAGTGYSVNDRLLFNNSNTGGYGAAAKVKSIRAGGGISSLTLISGGSFYEELPTITISSVNGKDADIVPSTDGIGSIKTLEIEDPGYDYPSDYTLNPSISPPLVLNLKRNYSIESVDVINGGSGHLFEPELRISGGSGIGASFTANISNGLITKINVINGGYGFSNSPSIVAIKKYPFTINTSNNCLVFEFPINSYLSDGMIVSISSDTNQLPSIGNNINPISTSNTFYVIKSGLDEYSIRLSQNQQLNNYVTFNNAGLNLKLVVNSNSGSFKVNLYSPDYFVGEKVSQGNFASGIVSEYKKNSKILKLTDVVGTFKSNNTPIIGEISKTRSYLDTQSIGSGTIKISPIGKLLGKFLTETGILSNSSQLTIDSNYYQTYSYALKNEIDYSKWASSVKNIAHPSGFALFGEKNVYTTISSRITGTGTTISLQQNIYSDKSLNQFSNYLICEPEYGTNIVKSLNRNLSSYEIIKSSFVDRFDDVGDGSIVFNNVRSEKTFAIPQKYAIIENSARVTKDDISVYVNNSLLPSNSWQLRYTFDGDNVTGANIILNNSLSGTENVVKLIFNGLNFDGIDREYDLKINDNSEISAFQENQILVYLNQILQDNNSYSISTGNTKTYVNFSEPVLSNGQSNLKLRIFGFPNNILVKNLISTGSSFYEIGSGYSSDTSLVVYDGVIQSGDQYTISGDTITFTRELELGKLLTIRDFKENLVAKEQIIAQSTGSTFYVSNQILNKENAIIVVDGIISDSTQYQIGNGNTEVTFTSTTDTIDPGNIITVYNFSGTQNLYYEKYSNIISERVNCSSDNNFVSGNKIYRLNTDKFYESDNFLVINNNIIETPGEEFSYTINSTNSASITFQEAPKERTKFLAFLYRRKNPSTNAILDNISKSYLQYSNYTGPTLNIDSYIQQENTGAIAIVEGYNTSKNTIIFNNISSGQSFSTGQTIVGVGTTTNITTYISGVGITSGASSIPVNSTSNFSANDYILINSEVLKINSISSNNFNVSRARIGTTSPSFHPENTLIIKLNPIKFNISSVYTGFNGTKTNFSMSTGSPMIDYITQDTANTITRYALNYGPNSVSYTLENSSLDIFGKNNQQSLFTTINGVVQQCSSGTGNSAFSGSFALNGSQFNFISSSDAPREGSSFISRYFGKLRRLKDISYLFNGNRTTFSMDIGGNDESIPYSLETSNQGNVSNNLIIFINDTFQIPNESFTVSGSLITFSSAPQVNSTFYGYVYIGSDDDVNSVKVLPEIEKNDLVDIDTEISSRSVISVNSSKSILTSTYNLSSGAGTSAIGSVIISDGRITGVDIINSGQNYTEPPVLWFDDKFGSGAQAYTKISNGQVTDIIITNPGSNYSDSTKLIFAKSLSLTKKNPVRVKNISENKKNIKISSGVTFGSNSITLESVNNLNQSGSVLIIDQTKPYTHSELIYYESINSTTKTLTNCSRRLNTNFDRILLTQPIGNAGPLHTIPIGTDDDNNEFRLGSTITGSSSGAIGEVIYLGTGDPIGIGSSLIFINLISPQNFVINDIITIKTKQYRILNPNYETLYYQYQSGVEVIIE